MRRRGFTLIETLIALAVAISVLGASISAARGIQVLNTVQRHQSTMEAIARDSLRQVEAIGYANSSFAVPYTYGSTGYGMVVAESPIAGTYEGSGTLIWCSEARIADASDDNCSSALPRVSLNRYTTIKDAYEYLNKGDLVAVAKPQATFSMSGSARYKWFDQTSFITHTGNPFEVLYVDSPAGFSYAAYRRSIRVEPQLSSAFNADVEFPVSDPGLSELQTHTYLVTIVVESLADRSARYVLSTTLSDPR